VDAFSLGAHQPRPFEPLQMLRGIGHAHLRFVRQFFHGARRLHQQIYQFQPMGIGQGIGDLGKELIEPIFVTAFFSSWHRHFPSKRY